MGIPVQSLVVRGDPLETWRRCGGYYTCPKDSKGKRRGPLVGYAEMYDAGNGEKKQFVGEVYWSFARVEQYPEALDDFAEALAEKVRYNRKPTLVLGAPMGGILLAGALGRELGTRVIFAEKKVTAVETPEKREESKLLVARHEIRPQDFVFIVEDVCNNFSTTHALLKLIIQGGGMPIGIACALNCSEKLYYLEALPVVSCIYRRTKQWRQNDPAVAEDIAHGNVVWKPKDQWHRLAVAMERGIK